MEFQLAAMEQISKRAEAKKFTLLEAAMGNKGYAKFWEGAAVSLTAFSLGIFLAYLHVFLASVLLFTPFLKGWSVLYPQFRLTPNINIYQIAVLFFLTVIPYTVVTIMPSWRSATIDPDSVMRM